MLRTNMLPLRFRRIILKIDVRRNAVSDAALKIRGKSKSKLIPHSQAGALNEIGI